MVSRVSRASSKLVWLYIGFLKAFNKGTNCTDDHGSVSSLSQSKNHLSSTSDGRDTDFSGLRNNFWISSDGEMMLTPKMTMMPKMMTKWWKTDETDESDENNPVTLTTLMNWRRNWLAMEWETAQAGEWANCMQSDFYSNELARELERKTRSGEGRPKSKRAPLGLRGSRH